LHVYETFPFGDKSLRVTITQDCHTPGHIPPGKDLVFPGIAYTGVSGHNLGTAIHAMEDGIVRFLRTGMKHCPDPNNCPGNDNMILVEGNDGYYTGYHHVRPEALAVGLRIRLHSPPFRTYLGTLDDSGRSYGAHIHIGRYAPGPVETWYERAVCDWAIKGVDA
jgi:hypothetical protein